MLRSDWHATRRMLPNTLKILQLQGEWGRMLSEDQLEASKDLFYVKTSGGLCSTEKAKLAVDMLTQQQEDVEKIIPKSAI